MNQADFKFLDSKLNFHYSKDLYNQIYKLSYTYVSEYVYHNYYKAKKSIEQICLDLNLSRNTGYYWMKTWSFKSRTKKESQQLRRKNE